jgi:hypothetical protein
MGGTCLHALDTSMDSACKMVKLSLAQKHCDIGDDKVPTIIANDPDLIREWASWVSFQRAYRAYMDLQPWSQRFDDATRTAAHQWACDHAGEHRFLPINLCIEIK